MNDFDNGFIQKSTIQEDGIFYAFVNASAKKSSGVIEYIVWNYLVKMTDTSTETIQILSLPNGKEQRFSDINITDLNEDLKKVDNLNLSEDIVINVSEDITLSSSSIYSLDDINNIE